MQDIIHIAKRRNPYIQIIVYPYILFEHTMNICINLSYTIYLHPFLLQPSSPECHLQREHIFMLLFRVEFNSLEEMEEQVKLYFEEMEQPASEEDEEYNSS